MKTVITLAIGFFIGREIYLKTDKQKILKKEAEIKRRLRRFLSDNEMEQQEIEGTIKDIVPDEQA